MESKRENETESTIIMEEGGIRHITIELSLLESSLKQKIGAEGLSMSPNCCIFKTPKILFRHNAKAYLPNAFSIGPFHHGKKNLKATEKIKHKYMKGLVHRSNIPLFKFTEVINEIEKEARENYAGPIALSKDDFKEMLVLDGCFIIELFRKDADEKLRDEDDPIFNMPCMLQFLYHDLILLENQIPWKVLELLFDLTTPNSTPMYQLAIRFFSNMFSSQALPPGSPDGNKFDNHRSKHILDLLRNWMVLLSEHQECSQTSGSEGDGWQPLPSATKLKDAGVKFLKVAPKSILDVKFRNGTLEIPSLLIQETTETIFRNLISLEQCTPNYSPIFTSYAKLMDDLIDTPKDMEILCEEKIIDNWLNIEDSTQFFNKLYNDAYVKKFYYYDVCNQVNEYCKHRWPRWRAILMHNYFDTPWHIAGTGVAILVLLLSITDTVCSIIQAKYAKN